MREHSKGGHDMIVRALGYQPPYAHIIDQHHERCDGSGYPEGRTVSQIALDSQVVAIVDAFDALTSKRSYKPAVSAFDALHLLRVGMRGQYNDDLLREFIKLLGGWNSLDGGLPDALAAG